ncbi:MMPL family transporter [Nocardia transvalensis]|uniref:MMPL family transporter n=1 Tax=Nocardia transvalensis TaxID=37333 RepID=UPI0018935807|nr:MMPL family transporter [Nocardia transvalensis]MBF6330765.1 MMPL family transporter [Nocardia transvalensis]
MLRSLVSFALRRHRAVLLVAAILTVLAASAGPTLFGRMQGGGYFDPASESTAASAALRDEFGQGAPNLVLLVDAGRSVDDAETSRAATALVDRLRAERDVTGVLSYWTDGHPAAMRDKAGTRGLVVATILGDEMAIDHRIGELAPHFAGRHDGLDVQVGGYAMMLHETVARGEKDIVTGESVAFPLTLIALLLVFGSIVGAALPLIAGTVTTVLTLGTLWLLTTVTELAATAANIASLLGLGLAIDYSLLIVSRYREELATGAEPRTALTATLVSAGRTVGFSALTVAIALSSMLFFPLLAVRSIGYAGIAVAAIAALVSLTVLPAVLLLSGNRIATSRFGNKRTADEVGDGFWHRLATTVMRRPVPIATVVIVILLALGAPFLRFVPGFPDYRSMPGDSSARQVAEAVAHDFDATELAGLFVVLPDSTTGLADYAAALSRVEHVQRVDTATGSYMGGALALPPTAAHHRFENGGSAYLSIVPTAADPDVVHDVIRDVRAQPAPSRALVGGVDAANLDAIAALTARAPVALAYVVVLMLVLLFLLTGSVIVPVIALVLSAFSLTATFGALVWIFQEGHLSGLLGFTVTGDLSAVVPVMLFAVAFGLAMDYQVFLLSRIREEYENTGDNTASVAIGLERIGRIVTAAAVLISIVFLGFLASDITFMKAFGIGLPLAVLADATLIRGFLLPAALRLSGRWTWWSPLPLRRLHARIGLRESDAAPAEVSA